MRYVRQHNIDGAFFCVNEAIVPLDVGQMTFTVDNIGNAQHNGRCY